MILLKYDNSAREITMSMTPQSSKYFSQVAGSWDQIRSGYFGQEVREAAIAKAYLRPEMAVADVGAGTGFIAAGLAPLVKRVYLFDGSAAMLEVAKKNLSEFKNVEYHKADGSALPFPEECFEAAFANMYLHHTPDPQAAIKEIVRVMVPGGRLVITDMDSHPYAWLKDEMADRWQGFDRSQIREWFQSAGLVNVIVDCTGQSCCAQTSDPLVDNQGREARISIFVAAGTKRLAMRDAVEANYAAVAKSTTSSCCSPGSAGGSCCSGSSYADINFTGDYSPAELSAAPKEAADISLGCGNPTALAGLKPGEVVLDIGSGGGLDAFLAAGKVGPTGRVIGVDMTPEMLARARASAARNGVQNVEFRQGYAEAIPVEDGTVDVIISNCVINLTEDKGQVFREAFRVLKPGGRLEVSDVVTSGAVPLELRLSETGWSECVTGALPEPEYLDLIAQAGFQKATVRRSPNLGSLAGILVYSAVVSAQKPVLNTG